MQISDLSTPAALIERSTIEANAKAMAQRAHRLAVRLRPHVKTHKCVEIARLQVEGHFGGITVSTFAEAEFFGAAGFRDITLAVPIALGRLPKLFDFSQRMDAFHMLVDAELAVSSLVSMARDRKERASVFLKVDCGYGRAGVIPHSPNAFRLAQMLSEADWVDFRGLLTHGGHSYDCTNRDEIRAVAEQERLAVVDFAAALRQRGIAVPEVSVGSTPTMCVVEDLSGVTEIRPGNYVLFDQFQATIGSCAPDDVAISVLATVIGSYPDRFILDCGALALSKDVGPIHVDADCGYGRLMTEDMKPIDGLTLVGLSQEHGKVVGPSAHQFQVGDRLRVVPNHSCLTMACFESAHIVDGDHVVAGLHPCRGWS